jgi:hypothetical protein
LFAAVGFWTFGLILINFSLIVASLPECHKASLPKAEDRWLLALRTMVRFAKTWDSALTQPVNPDVGVGECPGTWEQVSAARYLERPAGFCFSEEMTSLAFVDMYFVTFGVFSSYLRLG